MKHDEKYRTTSFQWYKLKAELLWNEWRKKRNKNDEIFDENLWNKKDGQTRVHRLFTVTARLNRDTVGNEDDQSICEEQTLNSRIRITELEGTVDTLFCEINDHLRMY